jgi:3',5'-cyclic-AMP phosphodiesterase
MLLAHISDFHVFAHRPETALVRLDASEAARRVVDDIAAFRPGIDCVIFTGDLTDGGSTEDYAVLSDLLAPLSMPLIVVPGNHDKRPTLRRAFSDRVPFQDGDFLHYETELAGLRILALDTLVDGRVEGRLCPPRLTWLEDRLSRPSTGPLLIAMHHPPFPSGIKELDDMALVGGATRMGELIAAQRGSVRILCGHIHRPIHALWNGAFAATAGSPAFQVDLDLDPDAHEPGPVSEPYAYYVHHLDANGNFAVHTRYVRI